MHNCFTLTCAVHQQYITAAPGCPHLVACTQCVHDASCQPLPCCLGQMGNPWRIEQRAKWAQHTCRPVAEQTKLCGSRTSLLAAHALPNADLVGSQPTRP